MSDLEVKKEALLQIIEAAKTVGWSVGVLNPFNPNYPIDGIIVGTIAFMQSLIKVPVKVYEETEEDVSVSKGKYTLQ